MTVDEGFERFLVPVGDGRTVEVGTAGPADGLALVFHIGTPSGVAPYEPLFKAAADVGLRTVQYSRPGYGDSGASPGRRVGDAAADVAAILDHLGAEEFVTAGWSGGGPHALACAALLPDHSISNHQQDGLGTAARGPHLISEHQQGGLGTAARGPHLISEHQQGGRRTAVRRPRCLGAATIAGLAPHDAPGLDWLGGMAPENLEELGIAAQGEAKLGEFLRQLADMMGDVAPDQLAETFGDLITAPDKAVMTGDFASFMAEAGKAAVRNGIAGWRDDDLAFLTGWGFWVADITIPVAVWQGDADAMVPFAHGSWLAANIPGATGHLLAGQGHLTLVADRIGEIIADLAAIAGRR